MRVPDYLGSYLDRRMEDLIREWDLATRRDLGDLPARLSAREEEARKCAGFEASASAKLTELEERLDRVRRQRT
ncbi:MAG: hypothetical protein QXL43_01010 [Methanolinea sp.]